MAILQEANAVFYHPLDDPTESLQAQAWTGSADFTPGKVADAMGGVSTGEISGFGAESEFLGADGAIWNSVAILSATGFVVTYADASDLSHGTARVGTVSGTAVTFGAEAEFLSAGAASFISAAALSATSFVVAYTDGADSGAGTIKVGTVSGTAITFGAEAEFSGASTWNSVAVLSATAFVVAYRDGAGLNHGTAKVGTVSGTDITFGAEAEFIASDGADVISAAALSATRFVVAYRDGTNLSHGTVKVGTVSGTAIAFGAEAEFLIGTMGTSVSAVTLSATGFVVAYRDDSDSGHGTAKVGTVSGTDVTFGAEAEFLSAGTASDISVAALSATGFVVAYADASDLNHGTAKVGTVSGTDVTFGAEAEFLGADGATFISAAALSATRFVVAYRDGADANHGTAKVGTAPEAALLVNMPAPFGPGAEFLGAGAASDISVAALSATKFVVAYQDNSDSNHGTAKVGSVSGGTITFGAETEFLTASTTDIDVDAIDATKFIVVYTSASTGHGKARVGTVTGLGVAFGTETEFLGSFFADEVRAAVLSPTAFVVAYKDGADASHGTAKVGTVSGTAITFGAEAEFLSGGVGAISVAALSATMFVVAYVDVPDSSHGTVKVGTVSGTAITFGPDAEFLSAGGADFLSATVLTSTKFIIAYQDNSDSSHGTAKVGTVSGTAVTFGAEAEFNVAGAAGSISVDTLSATAFVVAWGDSVVSGHGTARVGTVSGTAIAFAPAAEFLNPGRAEFVSVSTLGSPEFVVAYADSADLNHGTVRVGGQAELYATAVGAARLAFSSWVRD